MAPHKVVTRGVVQVPEGRRIFANLSVEENLKVPLEREGPWNIERIYKLFFLCELTGGAAATSLETSAVDWFALDDLPPLSVGRTLPEDIALLADAQHQPDSTPCYFD